MIDTHACVAVRANWNVQVRTKAALGELRRWLREMQWEVSERVPVSQEPPAAGARQSKMSVSSFFVFLMTPHGWPGGDGRGAFPAPPPSVQCSCACARVCLRVRVCAPYHLLSLCSRWLLVVSILDCSLAAIMITIAMMRADKCARSRGCTGAGGRGRV